MSAGLLGGQRVAIANRGEIAIRIAVTVRRFGGIPVALLGEPDLEGMAARQIGIVEPLGPAGSELNVDIVVAAAKRAGARFLHPGYGFLSERAELAQACIAAGITFVGPSPETLSLCGDKLETRAAADRARVPVLPATDALGEDPDEWLALANDIGYPMLVKPSGAGGGRGLRQVADADSLLDAIQASRREGATSGSPGVVYLERELVDPRHIEVQLAAGGGIAIALGDRDCSLQRRHQKVIEEAPAPNLDLDVRRTLHDSAVRLAREVGLNGIATCEFLLGAGNEVAFLEINPRIQVEHPVTELVTGIDLVEWQLRIALGEPVPVCATPHPRGHAIEARVYAEDPARGFLPSAGTLDVASWPYRQGVRVDAGYGQGDDVPTTYDAMLAKVVAHAADRAAATTLLGQALGETVLSGVTTNLSWLRDLLAHDAFGQGMATTATAVRVPASPSLAEGADLAALAHLLTSGDAEPDGAWAALGAWRQHGPAAITLHTDEWERRYRVERDGHAWRVTVDGMAHPVRWWRGPDRVWTIAHGEEVRRYATASLPGGIAVTPGGGRTVTFTVGPRAVAAGSPRRQSGTGDVRAPMPGRVVNILVAVGDEVEVGQAVAVLTAMKMELTCGAPMAGVVSAVHCAVDEIIPADYELVTITPENRAEP